MYFLCFFFVYSMHINHFFLLFHIARIYVIFFRIRIDVLIVLESIIICFICFIGYFYHKRTRHTDKPNCFSQKYTKRIRICILFLYLSPLFWQCHCHKPITIISPLFRQWHYHKPTATIFFPLLFQQCHCHKSIPQFFYFFYFFIKMICAYNFYNIFTTNFKCQVVIVGLKK